MLTAISAVLDVPADELPGRVALVRRYIGAVLEGGARRPRASRSRWSQMLVRDASRDRSSEGAATWACLSPWS